jgi:hypothetical protein
MPPNASEPRADLRQARDCGDEAGSGRLQPRLAGLRCTPATFRLGELSTRGSTFSKAVGDHIALRFGETGLEVRSRNELAVKLQAQKS